MANKVTIHFKDDRADRATYIAMTVGFGEIVQSATFYKNGIFQTTELTETGVMIIRGVSNALVTMFIAKPSQIEDFYKLNRLGKVPNWLMVKAKKNKNKGYIANQPGVRGI